MTNDSTVAEPARSRWWRVRRWSAFGLIALIVWRLILMFGSSAPQVGLVDGKLRPCPTSPNCVSSQATDALHQISPLRFTGSAAQEWDRLHETIQKIPRTRVITRDDRYMHVEFTTALMRFVDDVEFLLDEPKKVIHIRSASRIGHSDLGTNRKRMEQVRSLFETQ